MRTSNKERLKNLRGLPCIICGAPGEAHHLRSKGAGGGDEPDNTMVLCRTHHREIHDIGRDTFITKYRAASDWAEKHNWIKCKFYKYKWYYCSEEGIVDEEF